MLIASSLPTAMDAGWRETGHRRGGSVPAHHDRQWQSDTATPRSRWETGKFHPASTMRPPFNLFPALDNDWSRQELHRNSNQAQITQNDFSFLRPPPFSSSAPRVICSHDPFLWACLWRPNPLLEKQADRATALIPGFASRLPLQPAASRGCCGSAQRSGTPGSGGKHWKLEPFKRFAPPFSRIEASEASSMLLAVVTRKRLRIKYSSPPRETKKKTPFPPSFSPRNSKPAARMTVHFSCGTPRAPQLSSIDH